MNRRRFFRNQVAAMAAGLIALPLVGCGSSVSSNVEEERVSTQEDYEKTKRSIDEGMKNMSKPAQ